MHVIMQREFGPAHVLRLEDVPDLQPAEGQVRIATEAAGVHLIDTVMRAGTVTGVMPLPDLPTVPGREVAGVVDAVGSGVDGAWVGRRVVAYLGPGGGGYAEQALAPAAALHPIPDHLAADAAVAMIGTGRTALAILELAAPRPGDVVLVTAAAGGLGALFVQAARNAGATAVALAGGPEKVERVRALGADVAVDYRQPDWPDQVRAALGERTVTVALDGVGGDAGRAALDLLGTGGHLVMYGYASGSPTTLTTADLIAGSRTASWAIGPRILARPGGLRPLETAALAEAAAGRLVPLVANRYPLAQAADAHVALQSRATVGKVVLVP